MLRRHADHYLAFAAAASDGQRGPDEVMWARRVDQELANLRAVHTFVLDADDLDAALRLSASMFTYAYPRMRSEVLRWAEQVGGLRGRVGPPAAPTRVRVGRHRCVATGQPRTRPRPGDGSVSTRWTATTPRWRGTRWRPWATRTCSAAGSTTRSDCFRRSRELAEFAGDAYRAVTSTWNDALALTYAGLTEDARAVAADSIDGAEQLGSPSLLAYALYAAGEAAADVDPDAAAELFAGALEAGRAAGAQFVVGITSLSAATLQARRGDPYEALRWYPELCEHWRRAGVWTQQWTTLRTLVELFTRIGRDEAASMLFGALMTATTAAPVFGADRVRLDDAAKVLEGRMGHDEFEHTILARRRARRRGCGRARAPRGPRHAGRGASVNDIPRDPDGTMERLRAMPSKVNERSRALVDGALDRVFDEPFAVETPEDFERMMVAYHGSSGPGGLASAGAITAFVRSAAPFAERALKFARVGSSAAGKTPFLPAKIAKYAIFAIPVALSLTGSARRGVHELQVLASFLIHRFRQHGHRARSRARSRALTIAITTDPDRRPNVDTSARRSGAALGGQWILRSIGNDSATAVRSRARLQLGAIERLDLPELARQWAQRDG